MRAAGPKRRTMPLGNGARGAQRKSRRHMAETVKDTERAQAGVRLLSALLVTVYAPILA